MYFHNMFLNRISENSGIKRIEVIVQNEMSKQVANAIRRIGTDDVTWIQSFGQGDEGRPEI